MRPAPRWLLPLVSIGCSLIFALLLFWQLAATPSACQAADCPQAAVTARQPYPTEMAPIFDKAGLNQLGTQARELPMIYKGYPTFKLANPTVPCVLLKAVGYTESGWKQFDASFGQSGPTLISFDCGYGVMQITSGMDGTGGYDTARVAGEVPYNIGTGALYLIRKWNALFNFIGTNDPAIAEDWYYAVWAYNGWGYVNNPNNPGFKTDRPAYTGTQSRWWYPYQELVWGFAANPPKYNSVAFWPAQALTLPKRSLITNPPPESIARPSPAHVSCLKPVVFLPVVKNLKSTVTPKP